MGVRRGVEAGASIFLVARLVTNNLVAEAKPTIKIDSNGLTNDPTISEVATDLTISSKFSNTSETAEDSADWGDELLGKLGKGYRLEENTIWYTTPNSERKVPVLMNLNERGAAIQYTPSAKELQDSPNQNSEGGRETVRYVKPGNLNVLPEVKLLVGVTDYDHRAFTFDPVSGRWKEKLGNNVIAEYVDNKGSKTIKVWTDNDNDGDFEKTDSGWSIDSKGALIISSDSGEPESIIDLEKQHPSWTEALKNGIGPTWSNYKDCETTDIPDTCQLRLVTDGKLDLEPKELKAKDEVLATAVISLDEYYLDKNSNLQKVSVPQIIRLPDGRLVKIGMDFIDEGIIERAKKLPIKADGGQKGLIVYPLMSSNAAEFAQVAPFLSDGDRKVAELVTKYNEANQENMKRFLEDGDPSIKVIFPVLNCLAADEIVNLPGN